MKNIERNGKKGITLIALIITIIVLLILAGISLVALVGDNGILKQSTSTKAKTEIKQAVEQAKVGIAGKVTENLGQAPTEEQVKEVLNEYFYNVPEDLTDREQELDTKPNRYKVKLSEILENTTLGNEPEEISTTFEVCSGGSLSDGYTWQYYRSDNQNIGIEYFGPKWDFSAQEKLPSIGCAWSNSYCYLYVCQPLNFDNIDKIEIDFCNYSDLEGLTIKTEFGLQQNITEDLNYDISDFVEETSSLATEHSISIDTKNISGEYYVKMSMEHGPESSAHSIIASIRNIRVYYSN